MTVDWVEANRAFYASGVWQTVVLEDRRIYKYPTDLWVYEEIIRETQPEVIVEVGSAQGGSALWFARFADVVSVDLRAPSNDPRVHWVEGNSTFQEVIALVHDAVAGRRCMVSLDSDHSRPHVRSELGGYAPLVSPGCYLVVEDTAVDTYGVDAELYPDGGPLPAVREFLERHPGFEVDTSRERFFLGMNPGGWLRRTA
jgi:cephalosporin hydroxylase